MTTQQQRDLWRDIIRNSPTNDRVHLVDAAFLLSLLDEADELERLHGAVEQANALKSAKPSKRR